ncbi:permease-like cell division protein FtsX [Alkalibacterium pelagium]|uniref:Cell division protein FtsX n=1 Tax=Alkalibacterium pelagium TaxID=426702 RepID=A0A1H7EY15_9LACT|nr:permease-like cell division protein FtsX [Alkalibacterium pelagium]GEN49563.1 cell division protein FtsX [Alkalibacterium pelagium]SEK18766.1 cell division protein FtsX [Alkalibacterium pelagium]
MKTRTFWRHIKESFKSIKRNGWMTVAAVSAVAVTLLLVGSFIAILMNVNKLATDVEEDVSVRVYIDLAAEEEDQEALQQNLEELDEVEQVVFSSRDDELSQVIGSYGDEFGLFDGDDNPLYDVFIVNTAAPEVTSDVADQVEDMNYVADVNYGGATADRLFEVMATVRNVGAVIIVALIFTAVFLIANTIRITIFSRRTEIEIMKLVGATNWFIRWPFLIEGALIGFIGALIPVSIISYIYLSGFDTIMTYLSGTYFALLAPNPFLVQLVALLLTIGVVIGSVGSSLSIRKFLKV